MRGVFIYVCLIIELSVPVHSGLCIEKKDINKARAAAFELILPADLAEIYRILPDSTTRANWRTKYWRMKDPVPSSLSNPYEEEFNRRFAFAWRYYSNLVGPLFLDDRGVRFCQNKQ